MIDELRERARRGELSSDEIALLARHLHAHQPRAARMATIEISGDYLTVASEPQLMLALVAISEDASEDEAVRLAAVRALARATGYHGKPVSLDL